MLYFLLVTTDLEMLLGLRATTEMDQSLGFRVQTKCVWLLCSIIQRGMLWDFLGHARVPLKMETATWQMPFAPQHYPLKLELG